MGPSGPSEVKPDTASTVMDMVQQGIPSQFITDRTRKMDGTEDLWINLGGKVFIITVFPQR